MIVLIRKDLCSCSVLPGIGITVLVVEVEVMLVAEGVLMVVVEEVVLMV